MTAAAIRVQVPQDGSETRFVVRLLPPGPGRRGRRSIRVRGLGLRRFRRGWGRGRSRSYRRAGLWSRFGRRGRRAPRVVRGRLGRPGRRLGSGGRGRLRGARRFMASGLGPRGRGLALEHSLQATGDPWGARDRPAGGVLDRHARQGPGGFRGDGAPAFRAARELADAMLAQRRPAVVGHGGDASAADAAGTGRSGSGWDSRRSADRGGRGTSRRTPCFGGRGHDDGLGSFEDRRAAAGATPTPGSTPASSRGRNSGEYAPRSSAASGACTAEPACSTTLMRRAL